MDPSFADRYLNEGFSGGEKKRNEILQMAILEPEIAILDETDSGLDIDALRVVAKGVQEVPRRPARARRARSSPTTSACSTSCSPTWCTSSSTAASSRPAAPSWPSDSKPRATRHGRRLDDHRVDDRSTSPRIKKDFPLLEREVHGKPPRLPRLGRHRRRSRGPCSTRWTTYYETTQRQRAPRRVPHRRGGHRRATRPPAAKVAALHRRAGRRARSCSPRTPPRRSTSSPTRGAGPTSAPATPWCSPRSSTTPTSCRGMMLQEERGIELRWIPHRRRRHARPRPTSTGCVDGAKLRRRHGHVERARHAHARCAGSPTPPTPPAPSSWSTPASTCPTSPTDVPALGRRLPRASPATRCRPDGHRRAVGHARSCSSRCRRSSAAAR